MPVFLVLGRFAPRYGIPRAVYFDDEAAELFVRGGVYRRCSRFGATTLTSREIRTETPALPAIAVELAPSTPPAPGHREGAALLANNFRRALLRAAAHGVPIPVRSSTTSGRAVLMAISLPPFAFRELLELTANVSDVGLVA
jgi:hypothetical protein